MSIMTDNYRAAEGLSGSRLGLLLCPAKFKYEEENPKEPTEGMKFGSLGHMAVLEPHLLSSTYAVMPEGMIRRGKAYGEWCAENSTKLEVKPDKWLEANQMAEALKLNPDCNNILEAEGKVEEAIFWEEAGVKCKGKLDKYLTELNVIVDYKTTNDASPKQFYWKVMDMGYLLQLAHYQAGKKATLGLDSYSGILIMAQESEAPFVSQVYAVPQAEIDVAHEKRRELLQVYKTCKETGIWPGYGVGIMDLERR